MVLVDHDILIFMKSKVAKLLASSVLCKNESKSKFSSTSGPSVVKSRLNAASPDKLAKSAVGSIAATGAACCGGGAAAGPPAIAFAPGLLLPNEAACIGVMGVEGVGVGGAGSAAAAGVAASFFAAAPFCGAFC